MLSDMHNLDAWISGLKVNKLDQLTVVILAHPIESHPSLKIINKTIDAMKFIGVTYNTRIIISHDKPRNLATKLVKENYKKYFKRLNEFYASSPNILITKTKNHAFLSGNIKHALKYVDTKYVLFVQHDLAFCREVDIVRLLEVMEQNDEIKHVRFNKRHNWQTEGWDYFYKDHYSFLKQVNYSIINGKVSLLRTLTWSDQNHLTTVDYYKKIVFPLCLFLKVYPEDVLNRLTCKALFAFFGNYVYGGFSDEATIVDLDGSKGRWDKIKLRHRISRRIKAGILFRVNKFRIWVWIGKETRKA